MVSIVGVIGYGIVTAFTAVAGSIGIHKYNKGDFKEEIEAVTSDPLAVATSVKGSVVDTVSNLSTTVDEFGGAALGVVNAGLNPIDTIERKVKEKLGMGDSDSPIDGVLKSFNSSNNDDTGTPTWMKALGIGGAGVAGIGLLKWMFGGKKDKITDDSSGLGFGSLTLALAAGVIGTLLLTNKPENEVQLASAKNIPTLEFDME